MEEQFENLDYSMQKVLDQHEYEFMQAYNIYVKKKEKELLDMIHELENRNKNNNLLDIKIKNLESTVLKLRKETEANEKTKESLRLDIRNLKQRADHEKQEKDFYHKTALEAKKKNKLLKVAVSRLQNEYDKLKDKYQITENELQFVNQLQKQIEQATKPDEKEQDASMFMTRLSDEAINSVQ